MWITAKIAENIIEINYESRCFHLFLCHPPILLKSTILSNHELTQAIAAEPNRRIMI